MSLLFTYGQPGSVGLVPLTTSQVRDGTCSDSTPPMDDGTPACLIDADSQPTGS